MLMQELEAQAKKELAEENIAEKKDLLKERLREIAEDEEVLQKLKAQYQKLLDTEV